MASFLSLARYSGSNLESTTLFSDNQSAIALSRDHQYHARTKHIDIRYHFIRWVIDNGSIRSHLLPYGGHDRGHALLSLCRAQRQSTLLRLLDFAQLEGEWLR